MDYFSQQNCGTSSLCIVHRIVVHSDCTNDFWAGGRKHRFLQLTHIYLFFFCWSVGKEKGGLTENLGQDIF